jgi:hypothetical protein
MWLAEHGEELVRLLATGTVGNCCPDYSADTVYYCVYFTT